MSSAEQQLRDALALRQAILAADHADVATSMVHLAALLVDTDRFDEALPLARDARGIFNDTVGPQDWQAATAASAEGAALAGLQQYDAAEALLKDSWSSLSESDEVSVYFVAASKRWLIDYYRTTGQDDEAARLE